MVSTPVKDDPKDYGYVMRVLVALDQFVNVLANGYADETISARTGRCAAEGWLWARALQWALDKIQPSHTDLAVEHDKQRGKEIEQLEQGFEDTEGGVKPAGRVFLADHLRRK